MYKIEFTSDGDGLPTFDEDVDSETLNQYLHSTSDLQLVELPDSEIPFGDETMDVQNKFTIFECHTDPYQKPISPRGPPPRSNFEGAVNFSVEIDSNNIKKKKYLYSHRLNRIYVNMNVNFSVGFSWDASQFPSDAYIRATIVFADVAQAEKRVERCYQHAHESSNASGASRAIIMNVLRSAREPSSPDVHYCGVPELADSWYSVVVRTPQPTELAYLFLCKNSCSSGINRRPINIIFTLEDITGKVYGRQTMGARVCSCPRRDIGRDEETEGVPKVKRPVSLSTPTPQVLGQETKYKKVRIEVVEKDDTIITLPSFEVVGHRTGIIGLEVMLNMMEQSRDGMVANKHTTDTIDMCITNIKKHINNLKDIGQKQ